MNIGSREVFELDAKPYLRKVAYLESHGTEWLDTLYVPNEKTIWQLRCAILSDVKISTERQGRHGNGQRLSVYAELSNSQLEMAIGDYSAKSIAGIDILVPYDYEWSIPSRTAKVSGIAQVWTFNQIQWTNSDTLYLFGRNVNGQIGELGKWRNYSHRILENGILLQDFIPVLDLLGRPCMYDAVTGQFFYNQGTGEFTYGELEEEQ